MNIKKFSSLVSLSAVACVVAAVTPSPAFAAPNAEETTSGTTYYVSASGNDANDGQSEAKPFRTLTKVNTLTLHAGDKILLKRGDTFNDQHLCISGDKQFTFNDGTACAFQESFDGAPLIISAYGEGGGETRHRR